MGLLSGIVLFGCRRLWLVLVAGSLFFIFLASSFGLYDKIKHDGRVGVIVAGETQARFEPMESATTYFPLRTGQIIILLDQMRDWSKIRRSDGKSGWVLTEAVAII
jgi:hypothetical protein